MNLLHKAIAKFPNDPQLRYLMAQLQIGEKCYPEAINTLRAGEKLGALAPDNTHLLGLCLFQIGELRNSIVEFSKALQLDPDKFETGRALTSILENVKASDYDDDLAAAIALVFRVPGVNYQNLSDISAIQPAGLS